MKLAKFLPIVVLATVLISCSKPAGELVGAGPNGNFREANPYGMVFIKRGSFMMGSNTQTAIFKQPDNQIMVTVEPFWMDETEITNNEYRQFAFWVRDSIAYAHLIEAGLTDYALVGRNEEFDEENYRINWKKKIPWNTEEEDVKEILSVLYYENSELQNTNRYQYTYEWMNYDEACLHKNNFDVAKGIYPKGAQVRIDTSWTDENWEIHDSTLVRVLKEPKDLLTKQIICVYPDTLVWQRDFQFAYNEPLLLKYFSHPAYGDYPVVGVTWEQADAFCHWRTAYFNKVLKNQKQPGAQKYRLPTETEWEYAARGGRKMAMYPWGGDYARDKKGCFLANFKPYLGSYPDDTGGATMKVAQFRPNDFGLFDMAGNVSEWTMSSFTAKSNTLISDFNPEFHYKAHSSDPDIYKRKVIRGGSWKDISYYMQCGARTYEYQYECRTYIGFRCVRSHIGD